MLSRLAVAWELGPFKTVKYFGWNPHNLIFWRGRFLSYATHKCHDKSHNESVKDYFESMVDWRPNWGGLTSRSWKANNCPKCPFLAPAALYTTQSGFDTKFKHCNMVNKYQLFIINSQNANCCILITAFLHIYELCPCLSERKLSNGLSNIAFSKRQATSFF